YRTARLAALGAGLALALSACGEEVAPEGGGEGNTNTGSLNPPAVAGEATVAQAIRPVEDQTKIQ
ncbi:MAG: hypothetical protein AAF637_17435, partial [Pseudomonadota bacterium]